MSDEKLKELRDVIEDNDDLSLYHDYLVFCFDEADEMDAHISHLERVLSEIRKISGNPEIQRKVDDVIGEE